ncbi:APC family permease [Mycoplasmopsis fermentans]|uniref:Amino acid permease n=1 Tax=Mycoplasmopsis fermentans (strain M64) TaxID=943945 RepID=A0AB32XBJ7_MYCFM|nr:APC family permease [Mycoplasmopsis fermentans]ADN69009.1 predicted amino acid permease [Mycoplasmopsis fermentans JER]ADV34518.1 Amino acid permease [Mycoplasmopsis fermentans M64]
MEEKQTKEKKISFIAAMLIVIGGSIGAGIFFKSGAVLKSSHSSLILAIFCWIIASFAVIAMALSLIEISSVKNDNLSLMSWCKVFNSKRIFRASKDFMTYIYLPLTYLFMPMYVIMSLQDGVGALMNKDALTFGTNADWLIWLSISLLMTVYFLTVPAIWSKVGSVQNIVVLSVKFIPLVFIAIMGFVLAFTGNGGLNEVNWTMPAPDQTFAEAIKSGKSVTALPKLGAGLGVFLAVAAIFFAYDGFYVAAGIQSEMKEPKKTPLAIFIGLGITTLIYLIVAISMSLNGGSFFGFNGYMSSLFKNEKAGRIVFGLINICISIGVLGIINGFSMWAPRYVEDLLATGDLPFWEKWHKKLNPNKPYVGIIYSLVITIPVVIIFTTIGALAYIADNSDYTIYSSDAHQSMARLYAFCDLMANWTALFTFGFIAVAIYGGIKNRKTNKIEIKNKKKYFLPFAWISVILVGFSLAVTILAPITDMFLLAGVNKDYVDYSVDSSLGNATLEEYVKAIDASRAEMYKNLIISRVALVCVLGIFAMLTFLPAVIEDAINKKKYGSLETYEEYKAQKLAELSKEEATLTKQKPVEVQA